MFTPLSKGSERRQYREWDENPITPDKNYGSTSTRSNKSQRRTPIRGGKSRPPVSPYLSPFAPQGGAGAANPYSISRNSKKTKPFPRSPRSPRTPHRNSSHKLSTPSRPVRKKPWYFIFLQPEKAQVESWLTSWWKRHLVLVLLPCVFVWVWVAMPFPAHEGETSVSSGPGDKVMGIGNMTGSRNGTGNGSEDEPGRRFFEPSFSFFLFYYYGIYLAAALLFITKLFDLYRLNWWPRSLGGFVSYTVFWLASLGVGWAAHWVDVFGIGERRRGRIGGGGGGGSGGEGTGHEVGDEVDWERKTFWITLAFLTMLMPALVCFSKLKRDKRHTYRHSLTDLQKAFLEREYSARIPASWKRFLWFMTVLGIASFSLIVGQAFASLYLKTLPHTSIDATIWVWSWIATVHLLNGLSVWIISTHIRSRALLFLYRYFFQVVLFTFYRNLFARLRSPQQFALIQLVSSLSVITLQPIQVTRTWHKLLRIVIGYGKTYEEHLDAQAITFYVRGVAQNVTILGFLGWLSILHFGTNSRIYPFFAFNYSKDPYTFQLTFLATLAIWAIELITSWVTRRLIARIAKIDVTEIGLHEMREYPELTVACGWTSVHILSNILLFLIKLDFR